MRRLDAIRTATAPKGRCGPLSVGWRYARGRGRGSPQRDDRHDPRARDGRGAEGERRSSRARRWRSRRSPTSSTATCMRHNPADPHWPDRDRFVLSAGHACILQYASLHLSGYDLTLDDLKQFRQWELAHAGPSRARAHGGRRDDDRAARPGLRERRRHGDRRALPRRALQPAAPRDRRLTAIYAICSDGDLMEGVTPRRRRSPATSGSAGSSTSTTTTTSRSTARPSLTFTTEDEGKRFEAYGWHVQHVDDSEDLDALRGGARGRARPRRSARR